MHTIKYNTVQIIKCNSVSINSKQVQHSNSGLDWGVVFVFLYFNRIEQKYVGVNNYYELYFMICILL